jgi:1-deoxy-D-xylulose-5-phosphate reductoisomerase
MRTAIAYALAWPERIDAGVPTLDLVRIARLDFEAPDLDTFRCLRLAYQALAAGGQATIALNAANEEAVAAFLDDRLPFLAIAETIERCLTCASADPATDLATILDADLTARRHAQRIIATLSA